ncbi:LuxR C-terminal-related transcriptional regulator [Actinoplanes sp. TRM 88003]|uniref:LuxR C-terminal-related transcriptional regulator n=1 Tax=Paractinoplanes aksuensis TaxID=2939490 RepID=A0ABT1DYL3_9ACTN|nr:LuxR C-terminal-related transcriptional regulator [Actinoplanes aksuensis]MCO8275903.1 LuxR C-terminal-related transcriptional regulator [Actinoplanes aksuensis]
MMREEHVVRRGLVQDLAAVPGDVPLMLLIAPPGYGKTVVLRQWAAADPRPFVWLGVEPADADPVRLRRRLEDALEPVRSAAPWVLVVDDLHVIRGRPGQQVIVDVIERLPAGCHLVVAARTRLGLPVGGLRAEGRSAEFGLAELRLSAAEALEVLRRTGALIPEEQALAVARRFDGWPVGIYLAALTLRDQADAAPRISGAFPYVSEYFRDVVLAGESAETVRFLMRSALLDPVSAGLCDAALRRAGSGQTLAGLAARNVFVSPVDPAVRSYRFHPAFRDMLLAELRRREPAVERDVHRRAAAWYERRRQPEPAVRHAAAAGEAGLVGRILARHSRQLVDDGHARTVAAALDLLGDQVVERDAGLAARAGWIYALAGRRTRPRECLAAAGDAPRAAAAADRLRAALAPGGVDNMLGYARRAARAERPGSPWYPVTTVLLGVAEELTGNTVLAMTRFMRVARAESVADAAALALAELGWHAAEGNDTTTAAAFAKESATLLGPRHQDGGWSALTHLLGARVALVACDRPAWDDTVARTRQAIAGSGAFPWLVAMASVRLARLILDAGDLDGARRATAEAGLALADLSTTGVLAGQLRTVTAELDRRAARAETENAAGLTAAELRVLHLLPTHLTLSRIAGDLRLSRNTVKTQVAAVYRKLGVGDRADAVRAGRDLGLIPAG